MPSARNGEPPPRRRPALRDDRHWLIWNLTGGADGGVHVTDVTNASPDDADGPRDARLGPELLDAIGIPRGDAPRDPRRRPRSTATGVGDLDGVPIAGDLGDQQAALFGQTCFEAGQAKCTYGTGCFMLMHTGRAARSTRARPHHDRGRAARRPARPPTRSKARWRSPASLIGWLRDNLGIIDDASEVEALARSVPDSGDVVLRARVLGPVRAALAERRAGRHRRA